MTDITIVKEDQGHALCHDTTSDKFTVVRISRKNGQVYDAMPTDGPAEGSWYAGISDAGVRYVAGWYSRGYAQRIFKARVTEAAALNQW